VHAWPSKWLVRTNRLLGGLSSHFEVPQCECCVAVVRTERMNVCHFSDIPRGFLIDTTCFHSSTFKRFILGNI
jgi:hypothetical protein